MAALFVGIDTSCYTTSLAVCNIAGELLLSERMPLPVEKDQRGLRQSDVVFLHIKNIFDLLDKNRLADLGEIKAVAASGRPRPQQGSYMPVFMVSKCIAAAVSSATGAIFMETTHQHAHIAAARLGNEISGDFLAVHLSGGTSEILTVKEDKGAFEPHIGIAGRTLDIPAGQLIDRIGQRIGFPFPCGPSLEYCAQKGTGNLIFKTSVEGSDFHFSGVEAQAARMLDKGGEAGDVSLAILQAVASTVSNALAVAAKRAKLGLALLFGGVISNEYIREEIRKNPALGGMKLVFAKKEFAADNAAGLAVLARDYYKQKEEL